MEGREAGGDGEGGGGKEVGSTRCLCLAIRDGRDLSSRFDDMALPKPGRTQRRGLSGVKHLTEKFSLHAAHNA